LLLKAGRQLRAPSYKLQAASYGSVKALSQTPKRCLRPCILATRQAATSYKQATSYEKVKALSQTPKRCLRPCIFRQLLLEGQGLVSILRCRNCGLGLFIPSATIRSRPCLNPESDCGLGLPEVIDGIPRLIRNMWNSLFNHAILSLIIPVFVHCYFFLSLV